MSSAVWVLGELGPDAKGAVPVLVTLLNEADKDSGLPGSAASALTAIGPAAKSAIPDIIALLKYFQGFEAEEMRQVTVVRALGKFGPDAAAAVPVLIIGLQKGKGSELQVAIIQALGDIGPKAKDAVPVLLKWHSKDDWWKRWTEPALERIDPTLGGD